MTKEKKEKVRMMPEQKKAFFPVLAGLIIFSLTCGANTAISSVYVIYSEMFHVPVSTVVLASSCMTGAGFLFMQFSGKFMKKFGVKKSMYVSYSGIVAGFLILAFAANVYMVWLGFAIMATTHAFGQASAMSAVIRGWIAPKYQGTYLGLVLGTFICGGAIYPALGGWLFSSTTLTKAFLILIPVFLVPALIGLALIKESAADAGVKPIGWSPEDEIEQAPKAEVKAAPTKSSFNMYVLPVFWICAVAMILQAILTAQLTLLATTLQMAGFTAAFAGSVASICSLIGFPANFMGGWLRDRFGIGLLTALSYIMVAVSCFSLYLFFVGGNNIALWVFVLTNALCRPYMNIYAFATGTIFKENAILVQPKLQSFSNLSSMVLLPFISSLAEKWGGYANVCWIWIAVSFIVLALWLVAYRMEVKKTA